MTTETTLSASTRDVESQAGKNQLLDLAIRILTVAVLLYLFLIGVKVLEESFKLMGGGFAKGLLNMTANPIAGLFSGMFATVLIQSSSVTTAIIVGLVSSGTLPLGGAIPMIMGANLGTSVTNTLVSLGYIKDGKHFRDAFAAATIHDFFNILTVAVLLPIELMTGALEKSAVYLSGVLYGSSSASMNYQSPIKAAIKPFSKGIQSLILDTFGFTGTVAGVILVVIAATLIFTALYLIVKTMKVLVESNKGQIIENLLAKNGYVTILFGTVLTIAVQSSSITTSLLVPMAGAGVISLGTILPVTIGANIGTTTTALLASLTGNISGLSIALVHFLFNFIGMLLWYVHPSMRNIPLKLCQSLANLTLKNRLYGVAYIVCVFFIIPFTLTMLL